jgi:hypothetical protein
LEYTAGSKADVIIGSNSGTLKMTPLINFNKILVANRNCTTCGGRHAYDPSLGVTWAVPSETQVKNINFAYHSSIPVQMTGTLMKDSICAKQAEQDGYMCVNENEDSMAPFYLVQSSELPVFA